MAAEYQLNDNDYELITAYIDGELTDAERTAFEARLQSEASLRTELATIRQTVEAVHAMPILKAPRNFTLTPEMVAETPSEPTSNIRLLQPRRNNSPWIFTAAAVVIIAVGLGFLLTQQNGGSAPTSQSQEIAVLPTLAELPSDDVADADIAEAPSVENTPLPTLLPASPIPDTTNIESEAAGEDDLAASSLTESQEAASSANSISGSATLAEEQTEEDTFDTNDEPQANAPAIAQAGEAEAQDGTGNNAETGLGFAEGVVEEEAQPEAMLEMAPPAENTNSVDSGDAARSTTIIPEDRMDDDADTDEFSVMEDEALEAEPEIRVIGDKEFTLEGDIWIDADYDSDRMELRTIEMDTTRFRRLNNRFDELDDILTELETGNIIVVLDDIAYEIVRE